MYSHSVVVWNTTLVLEQDLCVLSSVVNVVFTFLGKTQWLYQPHFAFQIRRLGQFDDSYIVQKLVSLHQFFIFLFLVGDLGVLT